VLAPFADFEKGRRRDFVVVILGAAWIAEANVLAQLGFFEGIRLGGNIFVEGFELGRESPRVFERALGALAGLFNFRVLEELVDGDSDVLGLGSGVKERRMGRGRVREDAQESDGRNENTHGWLD
jgi:hypothetical protein